MKGYWNEIWGLLWGWKLLLGVPVATSLLTSNILPPYSNPFSFSLHYNYITRLPSVLCRHEFLTWINQNHKISLVAFYNLKSIDAHSAPDLFIYLLKRRENKTSLWFCLTFMTNLYGIVIHLFAGSAPFPPICPFIAPSRDYSALRALEQVYHPKWQGGKRCHVCIRSAANHSCNCSFSAALPAVGTFPLYFQ